MNLHLEKQKWIWLLAMSLLLIFLLYILYEHRELPKHWREKFTDAGIGAAFIDNITHDEKEWFYKDIPTCVGYGDSQDECLKFERFCSGIENFGTPQEQVSQVMNAIENNGIHPECPLIRFD